MTATRHSSPAVPPAGVAATVQTSPARSLSARLVAPASPVVRRALWGGGAGPFALLAEAGTERHGPVPLWLDTPLGLAPELGNELDYGVFAGLAGRTAGMLAAVGARPGDVVAILKQPNVDVVALALAAARIGAIPALIAPSFNPDTTRVLLAQLRPAVTVTDVATAAALPLVLLPNSSAPALAGRVVVVDAPDFAPLPMPRLANLDAPAPRPRRDDELLAITHTSGTTGVPKLIAHTGHSLAGQSGVQVVGGRMLLSQRDVIATCLTSAHARTLSGLPTMAAVGAPHLAMVNPDPASAGPLLSRHRPSLIETFPNVFLRWEPLADEPDGPFANVRIFLSTFDAAHPRTIRTMLGASRRRLPLYAQAYAQSELGAIALSFRTRRIRERDARVVGLPALALARVRVVGRRTGRRVPAGRTGALHVRSPGLFAGYVDEPELTQAQSKGGWWDTGDVGSLSRAGLLRLDGRAVDDIPGRPDYLAWEDVLLDRLPELTELAFVNSPTGGAPQAVACTRDDRPLLPSRWRAATADLADLPEPAHMRWKTSRPLRPGRYGGQSCASSWWRDSRSSAPTVGPSPPLPSPAELPDHDERNFMDVALVLQTAFLVIVLVCPLSLVAVVGWTAWSRRRRRPDHGPVAPSATDDAEIRRMRAASRRLTR
jgi:acyl-coenzyme A synthetase/AMP-(fatty) acid ligase